MIDKLLLCVLFQMMVAPTLASATLCGGSKVQWTIPDSGALEVSPSTVPVVVFKNDIVPDVDWEQFVGLYLFEDEGNDQITVQS